MRMGALQKNLVLFFATGCYSGFSPGAPGTAGSVIGVALFWFLSPLPFPLYGLTGIAFIFLAIWCAARASAIFQKKDPSQVVIDEIAGFLVTMAAMPPTWNMASTFRSGSICGRSRARRLVPWTARTASRPCSKLCAAARRTSALCRTVSA